MRTGESAVKPSVWIFQGNPDRFDLDAYLTCRLAYGH